MWCVLSLQCQVFCQRLRRLLHSVQKAIHSVVGPLASTSGVRVVAVMVQHARIATSVDGVVMCLLSKVLPLASARPQVQVLTKSLQKLSKGLFI